MLCFVFFTSFDFFTRVASDEIELLRRTWLMGVWPVPTFLCSLYRDCVL